MDKIKLFGQNWCQTHHPIQVPNFQMRGSLNSWKPEERTTSRIVFDNLHIHYFDIHILSIIHYKKKLKERICALIAQLLKT